MKVCIMVSIMLLTYSLLNAATVTRKPHPIFSGPDRIKLTVTVNAYPDSVVPPAVVEAIMYKTLKTEMTARFSGPATTPVIITTPEQSDTDTATVTLTVLGYSIAQNQCSLYVEYRITDAAYDFSDSAIVTYSIDKQKLLGTYSEKKTTTCEQAIRLFVLDFLTTFWPQSDR